LGCYETFLPVAQKLAKQFDYKGAKWGKQVGPEGRTAPWDPTYLLHWQQPHPIFFAELEYRLKPTKATLKKWQTIVFETADYMADFPVTGKDRKYHLTPVVTANENGIGDDPAFEMAYWRWGLAKAQEWRERMGLKREAQWDKVLKNLAPLPVADGVYLYCNNWLDSYTKYNSGHPDLLGVCTFLPFVDGVDRETARRTVEKIDKEWQWANMWGWDYPWAAMAAGWDGAPDKNAPGFPDNGQWVVKWEGLKRAL